MTVRWRRLLSLITFASVAATLSVTILGTFEIIPVYPWMHISLLGMAGLLFLDALIFVYGTSIDCDEHDRAERAEHNFRVALNVQEQPEVIVDTLKHLSAVNLITARANAKGLLLQLLDAEQLSDYIKTGYFTAVIHKGQPMRLGSGWIIWNGQAYCVKPMGYLVKDDDVIAQLLHARSDPQRLLNSAYRSPIRNSEWEHDERQARKREGPVKIDIIATAIMKWQNKLGDN